MTTRRALGTPIGRLEEIISDEVAFVRLCDVVIAVQSAAAIGSRASCRAVGATSRVKVADGGEDAPALTLPMTAQDLDVVGPGTTRFQCAFADPLRSRPQVLSKWKEKAAKDLGKILSSRDVIAEGLDRWVFMVNLDLTKNEKSSLHSAAHAVVPKGRKIKIVVYSGQDFITFLNVHTYVRAAFAPWGPFIVADIAMEEHLNASGRRRLPFVGRAKEVEEIRRFIDEPTARVLRITGASGSGKTRLVLEALEENHHRVVWTSRPSEVDDNEIRLVNGDRAVEEPILVADECSLDDLRRLTKLARRQSRLKLLAISDVPTPIDQEPSIEVGPVDEESIRVISGALLPTVDWSEFEWLRKFSEGLPGRIVLGHSLIVPGQERSRRPDFSLALTADMERRLDGTDPEAKTLFAVLSLASRPLHHSAVDRVIEICGYSPTDLRPHLAVLIERRVVVASRDTVAVSSNFLALAGAKFALSRFGFSHDSIASLTEDDDRIGFLTRMCQLASLKDPNASDLVRRHLENAIAPRDPADVVAFRSLIEPLITARDFRATIARRLFEITKNFLPENATEIKNAESLIELLRQLLPYADSFRDSVMSLAAAAAKWPGDLAGIAVEGLGDAFCPHHIFITHERVPLSSRQDVFGGLRSSEFGLSDPTVIEIVRRSFRTSFGWSGDVETPILPEARTHQTRGFEVADYKTFLRCELLKIRDRTPSLTRTLDRLLIDHPDEFFGKFDDTTIVAELERIGLAVAEDSESAQLAQESLAKFRRRRAREKETLSQNWRDEICKGYDQVIRRADDALARFRSLSITERVRIAVRPGFHAGIEVLVGGTPRNHFHALPELAEEVFTSFETPSVEIIDCLAAAKSEASKEFAYWIGTIDPQFRWREAFAHDIATSERAVIFVNYLVGCIVHSEATSIRLIFATASQSALGARAALESLRRLTPEQASVETVMSWLEQSEGNAEDRVRAVTSSAWFLRLDAPSTADALRRLNALSQGSTGSILEALTVKFVGQRKLPPELIGVVEQILGRDIPERNSSHEWSATAGGLIRSLEDSDIDRAVRLVDRQLELIGGAPMRSIDSEYLKEPIQLLFKIAGDRLRLTLGRRLSGPGGESLRMRLWGLTDLQLERDPSALSQRLLADLESRDPERRSGILATIDFLDPDTREFWMVCADIVESIDDHDVRDALIGRALTPPPVYMGEFGHILVERRRLAQLAVTARGPKFSAWWHEVGGLMRQRLPTSIIWGDYDLDVTEFESLVSGPDCPSRRWAVSRLLVNGDPATVRRFLNLEQIADALRTLDLPDIVRRKWALVVGDVHASR